MAAEGPPRSSSNTPHPKPALFYGSTVAAGERMMHYALRRDPTVKFLVNALAGQGCTVNDAFFQVRECGEEASGGFVPGEGVVLCANHVGLQDEVNTILAHELVHAFDHCRAKNLDWSNLRHHACSEIRAANLSGQCHLNREFLLQGRDFVFREGHKACVRRKAQLSVAMNPHLFGTLGAGDDSVAARGAVKIEDLKREVAAGAVEAVWDQCYKDTAPFTGIP